MKISGAVRLIAMVLTILISAVFLSSCSFFEASSENDEIISNSEKNGQEEKKDEVETEKSDLLTILKPSIERETDNYSGDWSVYVENLENGERFEINNKKMRAASLIKLFIMGKVYEEAEKGTIKKDDVARYVNDMITISHNESSNTLVSLLGGGKYSGMDDVFSRGLKEVNSFAQSIMCVDTEQQRDMKDSRPEPIPQENYTSVVDCGILLGRLYRKELISPQADEEMLSLLKKQQRRGKIPAGLPEGIVCANKTGELSTTENDVAIVFSPGADYILCIMSTDVNDTASARKNITHISKMVYDFFN